MFNKKKVEELNSHIDHLGELITEQQDKIKKQKITILNYKTLISPEHYQLKKLNLEIEKKLNEKELLIKECSNYNDIKLQIEILNGEKKCLEVGLELSLKKYTDKYKANQALVENRTMQRKLISHNKDILIKNKGLAIDGNEYFGNILLENVGLLMTKSFNSTCEGIIHLLKENNLINMIKRMNNHADIINKHGELLEIKLNPMYIDLKRQELEILHAIILQERDEQSSLQREKEYLKEQARAEKEILRIKSDQEHELNDLKYKYNQAFVKNKNIDLVTELQNKINILEEKYKFTKRRLADGKSGYVYVVRNRDMKEGQYKIGITKRDIELRMNELGNASHSFEMEVVGYVFVDDCYGIENQLHRYLENKRINVVNSKKEWFYITLEEIKSAFWDCCGIKIELNENPCSDYIESKDKFNFLR